MKKIILLILANCIYLISFAQLEANNFFVTKEGRVNWQKVYEDQNISFEDLINTVKSNPIFTDIDIQENKITFLSNKIPTNAKESGFSPMTTQIYALGGIKAYFTIDYKEGRYRITALNISTLVPSINIFDLRSPEYEYVPIEESVGNGKGLKNSFIKRESIILDYAIRHQLKIIKSTDDNW